MTVARQIAVFTRLRRQPLWRLLASDNATLVLVLLQAHFLGNERRLPQSILYERLERNLEELRADGIDLPQPAQAYVSDWLTAGYLERYFPPGAVEEEYEISAAAAQAVRFIDSLNERRSTATESRLAVVMQQLGRLAEQTDSNPATRTAALVQEKKKLDRELENIKRGHIKILDDAQALERTREIIMLTDDLIGDFRHVRDEFDRLNRDLRARLLDENERRSEVLEALFAGVDVIAQSDAGRTFAAFWRLLTDPEQNKGLDDSLEAVLGRKFARKLQSQERLFLRRLTQTLLEHGGTVHDVLQNFARSLKHFVQSREYLEQRRINNLLNEAQRAAFQLKDLVGVAEKLQFELPLTSCKIRSLSQLELHDPSLNLVDSSIENAAPASIDLDNINELVAQSEIDFRTLKNNIKDCLTEQTRVSIRQVVEQYPAQQGLGSIVGYVALGSKHGVIIDKQTELVSWLGHDDENRAAVIPTIFFLQENCLDLN